MWWAGFFLRLCASGGFWCSFEVYNFATLLCAEYLQTGQIAKWAALTKLERSSSYYSRACVFVHACCAHRFIVSKHDDGL
jgi:hypothetical protein